MSSRRFRNIALESCPTDPTLQGFAQVGGLQDHIKRLRRIIIFPLLYPDFYSTYNIKQPRGILFHGPPGTGKTLVAKALAEECNKNNPNQPSVQFIHCNSADIFDKWVGSSEKKLRKIFDKAVLGRPSIIFFDEIDALAPARTFRQDHVHTSVVATLLTLMNGLDSKPGIIIIGATNRLDSLDPALRRTGRFDLEMEFKLPDNKARKDILQIQVKTWPNKPTPDILEMVADSTCGYCGSDLQALCEEAAVCSLERKYPLVKKVNRRVPIDYGSVKVEEEDFLNAQKTINPTSQRYGLSSIRCSKELSPLCKIYLAQIVDKIKKKWPHYFVNDHRQRCCVKGSSARVLITGDNDHDINKEILPALVRQLEHLPLNNLNLSSMREMGFRISEEGLAGVQIIRQARRTLPSVLVAPKIDEWWDLIDENSVYTIRSQLEEFDDNVPILFVATAQGLLPDVLNKYFENTSNALIIKVEDLKKKLSNENLLNVLKSGYGQIKCEKVDPEAQSITSADIQMDDVTKNGSRRGRKRKSVNNDEVSNDVDTKTETSTSAKKSKMEDKTNKNSPHNTRLKEREDRRKKYAESYFS